MIISQSLTFATSLNRKKPIQDKTQIKTFCKFESLIMLQLYEETFRNS